MKTGHDRRAARRLLEASEVWDADRYDDDRPRHRRDGDEKPWKPGERP